MEKPTWWQRYQPIIELVGLTIAWPMLGYLFAFHTLDWDNDYVMHPNAAVALAISGMLVWAWRNH